MVKYEGLFFEEKMENIILSCEEKNLGNINDKLHCTFKYHPQDSEIFNDIVGKNFEVYLTHYGNDGKNSGFLIKLPDELKKYYINYYENNPKTLKKPHITVSLASGEKAVNTNNLKFKALETPVKVIGRFGFWIEEGSNEYLSYNKV